MTDRVPLLMIRHGETQWNTDGRVQGFTDIPLSERGRAQVAGWRVPDEFRDWRWTASPLARARETALLLGAPEAELHIEPRLKEMHWGAWEGVTMADLAADMAMIRDARQRGGLDFRAPGGESARDVCERLQPWLARIAREGLPTIAVAHKGVVRAVYAMATGWDMRTPMARDLDWEAAHLFAAAGDGAVGLTRLDIPLAPARASTGAA